MGESEKYVCMYVRTIFTYLFEFLLENREE